MWLVAMTLGGIILIRILCKISSKPAILFMFLLSKPRYPVTWYFSLNWFTMWKESLKELCMLLLKRKMSLSCHEERQLWKWTLRKWGRNPRFSPGTAQVWAWHLLMLVQEGNGPVLGMKAFVLAPHWGFLLQTIRTEGEPEPGENWLSLCMTDVPQSLIPSERTLQSHPPPEHAVRLGTPESSWKAAVAALLRAWHMSQHIVDVLRTLHPAFPWRLFHLPCHTCHLCSCDPGLGVWQWKGCAQWQYSIIFSHS